MRRLLIAALCSPCSAARAQAQDAGGSTAAAEQARRAWFAHDAAGLVADSPRLLVQLPGADPSAALGPEQAAALLSDFLASAQEVETVVRAAREVEPGRGYVELQRRYRVAGTQEIRTQSLLLGYRSAAGWSLVELLVGSGRVAEADGRRAWPEAANSPPCMTSPSGYIGQLVLNRPGETREGSFEREADLRALQGRQAPGRDSHHLQAQSQAQAAARLIMARIAGVDLPREKRVEIALTYIYGIGRPTSSRILGETGVSPDTRVRDLSDAEVARLRQIIERSVKVEGALRTEIAMNIKRLMDIGSYRGIRHRRGLPVRGQRTHTNARTKKGPRRAIAGKKKVTKK